MNRMGHCGKPAGDKEAPRERKKGVALIVETNEKAWYASLLYFCTEKVEMLFELKELLVKSSEYRELIAKSLGSEAIMSALSQETVLEFKDMDEITTEEELRYALTEKSNLEVMVTSRIRKLFGDTQTAAIRLPVDAPNKVAEKSKVKHG